MRIVRLYAALLRVGLLGSVQYRASAAVWLIGMLLEPVVLLTVWSTIAEERGSPVAGYDRETFAAYYIVLMIVNQLTFSWVMETFQYRVQTGELSYDLLRPVHPIHADLTKNVAFKIVTSTLLIPSVLFVSLAFSPRFDMTFADVMISLPVLCFAFLLRFLIEWSLALAAFWTTRVAGINRTYQALAAFMSGRIAPLSALPIGLAGVAEVLPFYYCVGFPTEVILGQLDPATVARGLMAQLAWLAVAGALIGVTWKRAVYRYGAVGS